MNSLCSHSTLKTGMRIWRNAALDKRKSLLRSASIAWVRKSSAELALELRRYAMRQDCLLSRGQWFDHGLNLGFPILPSVENMRFVSMLSVSVGFRMELSQLHRNPTTGPDANKMDGFSALVGGFILQSVEALRSWLTVNNRTLSFQIQAPWVDLKSNAGFRHYPEAAMFSSDSATGSDSGGAQEKPCSSFEFSSRHDGKYMISNPSLIFFCAEARYV